jgi:hypothetical protein
MNTPIAIWVYDASELDRSDIDKSFRFNAPATWS